MNPALQALVGKTMTIKSIDDSAVNMLTIVFEDGKTLTLEAVNVFPSIGLIGIESQLQT